MIDLFDNWMYVYIIHCADDSYYTEVTNNLKLRYKDHEEGRNPTSYTYSRRPFKCLYWEDYGAPMDAIRREKQIKRWSRAKKKALIEGNLEKLRRLAKSREKSVE